MPRLKHFVCGSVALAATSLPALVWGQVAVQGSGGGPPPPAWQPAAPILAALISFIGGFWAAEWNRRQKADELFFKALDFLKGGSQERNLGIAAIELYRRRKRHRPLSASLLVGSAIYLLRQSKQGDAAHEVYNLNRIMAILLAEAPPEEACDAYRRLLEAIRAKVDGAEGGLTVDRCTLERWQSGLEAVVGDRTSVIVHVPIHLETKVRDIIRDARNG